VALIFSHASRHDLGEVNRVKKDAAASKGHL
jgi:hypothetical protein